MADCTPKKNLASELEEFLRKYMKNALSQLFPDDRVRGPVDVCDSFAGCAPHCGLREAEGLHDEAGKFGVWREI